MVYSGGTRVVFNPQKERDREPALRSLRAARTLQWQKVYTLLPILAAAAWILGGRVLVFAGISVAAALLAESLACLMFKKAPAFHDASSVFYSLLLMMVLPFSIPLWAVAAGSFFSIFFAKELCGGFGQPLFFPPAIGYLFLSLGLPRLLQGFESAEAQSLKSALAVFPDLSSATRDGIVFSFHSTIISEASLAALLLGACVLLGRRIVSWEPVIFFWAGAGATVAVLGSDGWVSLANGSILLTAFYGVTDTPGTPITKNSRRIFSGMTGILTALFSTRLSAHPFAILAVANATAPWIERWSPKQPSASRQVPDSVDQTRLSLSMRMRIVGFAGVGVASFIFLTAVFRGMGRPENLLFLEHPAGLFLAAALFSMAVNLFFVKRPAHDVQQP